LKTLRKEREYDKMYKKRADFRRRRAAARRQQARGYVECKKRRKNSDIKKDQLESKIPIRKSR